MTTYLSEEFIVFGGVKFLYLYSYKIKNGLRKEYYRCESCDTRLHVYVDIKKCQLVSSHTNPDCSQAHLDYQKRLKNQKQRNLKMMESIMEETIMEAAVYSSDSDTTIDSVASSDSDTTIDSVASSTSVNNEEEETTISSSSITEESTSESEKYSTSMDSDSDSSTLRSTDSATEPKILDLNWTHIISPIKSSSVVDSANIQPSTSGACSTTRSKINNPKLQKPSNFRYFDSPSPKKKVRFHIPAKGNGVK